MFEKEAEETFRKNYTEYCCGKELLSPYWDLWQDGAEYGYNKANEWHYVKDGDLPKEIKEYLVSNGKTLFKLQWYAWGWVGHRTDIIAWKEIVLPKE